MTARIDVTELVEYSKKTDTKFHDLRHTFATLTLEAGVDFKEKEIAEASDYGSDKKSHPVANTSATGNTISQTDTKSQEKSKQQSKAEQWDIIKNSKEIFNNLKRIDSFKNME